MTDIEERISFRADLLDDSRDDEGFITQSNLLYQVVPSMLDAKLIDSEDYNESYLDDKHNNLKLNAYTVNASGERLQLFIIDESTIDETSLQDDLLVSQRAYYESQFKRVDKIIKKSFNGQLFNSIQDSDKAKVLASILESAEGFEEFDVIEIFLVSLTVTYSNQGRTPQPRNDMYFKEEKINRTFKNDEISSKKEVLILKRLVDLNFLFNVMVSRGHREVLTIDFEKTFNYSIEAIKAAENESFASYLCVLKANVLADLYRQYSSRLLEKNVRSFLDFRGVNKGIKETIRKEPEKFIAYNNGLTITATAVKTYEQKRRLYIESLTDFQIVNGGQTTATIYFSKKDGLDVSQVQVMAKINVAKQTSEKDLEQLINNISEFSNAQSKVSKVDLRSRNPQLIKIKTLSESVLTPSGHKWFFERSRGEFSTILRKAGNKKARVKNEFKDRKFTKEQMAKYYSAWGDEPYMVKKGGEKIFRHFIEQLSPEEDTDIKPPLVDRLYYEDIISKIILFRKMEKLHGQGRNALGQIRSAVIPYSLSVLYQHTDNKGQPFDMSRIWRHEGLEDDLGQFLYDLMYLMNDLIKQYSLSDDYGEYSKKPELWKSIKKCKEIEVFMSSLNSEKILTKYSN